MCTTQSKVLAEPSVLHLSKLVKGDRKQRMKNHTRCVTCLAHKIHTSKVHLEFYSHFWLQGQMLQRSCIVYRQTYHTDTDGSTQAPNVHAGELIDSLYNHFTRGIPSVLSALMCTNRYNMHFQTLFTDECIITFMLHNKNHASNPISDPITTHLIYIYRNCQTRTKVA